MKLSQEERSSVNDTRFSRLQSLSVPILFGLFPVLYLYAQNVQEVPFSFVKLPIVVAVIASLMCFIFLTLITKNHRKASLIASLFWLFFWLYVPVLSFAYRYRPQLEDLDTYIIPLWFIVFGLLVVLIYKSKIQFMVAVKFSFVFGLTVVLMQIFSITSQQLSASDNVPDSAWENNLNKYLSTVENKTFSPNELQELPDIYYIVPDSYPRSDTLLNYFDFSNHEFDDTLTGLGFKILQDSYSNYNQTSLAVPSALSMSYYTTINSLDSTTLKRLWRKNSTYNFLESGGYRIINNSSYYATSFNEYADKNIECDVSNEFILELLNVSVLKPTPIAKQSQREDRRKDTICTIENIGNSAGLKGPKIVFTHLLPPHPPYLFDENGNDTSEVNLSLTGWTRWLAKEPYIAQLKYVNQRLLEQVQIILSKSDNAIIIIQSDHGPLSSSTESYNLSDTRPIVFKERSRNYTAVYLPDYCDKSLMYDSMSNVNTFRVVFNSCFGADFELLEDKIYYSPPNKFDAEFKDITDIVRSAD